MTGSWKNNDQEKIKDNVTSFVFRCTRSGAGKSFKLLGFQKEFEVNFFMVVEVSNKKDVLHDQPLKNSNTHRKCD